MGPAGALRTGVIRQGLHQQELLGSHPEVIRYLMNTHSLFLCPPCSVLKSPLIQLLHCCLSGAHWRLMEVPGLLLLMTSKALSIEQKGIHLYNQV